MLPHLSILLAQAATTATAAATTAPETAPASAPAAYAWHTENLLNATLLFAGTAIAGLILLFFLRKLLQRTRLSLAALVTTFAIALYAGASGFLGQPLLNQQDPLAYWILRLVAAALLFSFLRFLDRLAVIPLLTRGNKLPLPRFFHQIVNIVLALFAILIFGSIAFGWDIDKFLAGSAVVSIVLGLALQESLGNFFSGLVMNAAPPFALGDWIVCGDHEGRVVDMTWRAVTIHTNDDNFIVIPNATIAKADITNFHAPTTATARIIKVGLDYDVPPCDALLVLKNAALETPGVQASPQPFVYLLDFTDAAVLYGVKFWIANPADHNKIEHAVRVNVWYRLHGRGFGIPFPTYNVEYISTREKTKNVTQKTRAARLEAIDSVPLFQPLTLEQKAQLADSTDDYVFAPGQVVVKQGDAGESLFIIRKGKVDVLVTPEGSTAERQVATLGPGDFFGEMSVLTGQPRTATIRANTPISLVRVEKQDLQSLFTADPSLLEKISQLVAKRNVEREAILHGPGTASAPDTITRQQKSLLGRMMSFFRLGNPQ